MDNREMQTQKLCRDIDNMTDRVDRMIEHETGDNDLNTRELGCLYEMAQSVEIFNDDEWAAFKEEEWSVDSVDGDTDGFFIRTNVRTQNTGPWNMSAPVGILLHHTAGSETSDIPTLTRSGTGVSCNYYITRQGNIYEFAPYPYRTWHAGESNWAGVSDWNTHALGIELENYGNGQNWPEVQVQAIVWLLRRLVKQFPAIRKNRNLIARHLDVALPRGRKTDPHAGTFPYERIRREVFADDVEQQKPVPFKHGRYNFAYVTEWGEERAVWAAEAINNMLGDGSAASTDADGLSYIARKAYAAQPAGKVVAIAVGTKAVDRLTQKQEDATAVDKDKSDVWSGATGTALHDCLVEIESRHAELKGLAAEYRKLFPLPVKKPESSGQRAVKIIDDYFGTKYGVLIVDEAKKAGLSLPAACALVEQESNGRNIFGADWGVVGRDAVPFAHMEVTEKRVDQLVAHVRGGGQSNGVGLTQLTYRDFLYEAERLGGAHIVRVQLQIGFRLLTSYINKYGFQAGAAAYNAGEGNRMNVYHTYGASVVSKYRNWVNILK